MAQHAGGCFNMHRVEWIQSYLAAGGGRMLCWYRAPDAESVRIAMRQLGSDMSGVWAGSVDGNGDDALAASEACVVAELSFEDALDEERLGALCDDVTSALARIGLSMARAFRSTRGDRLVYVVQGEDESSLDGVLNAAGLSASSVWRGVALTPELPPA